MNSKNISILQFNSDHLFCKGLRPLVTVSTTNIPVLHSAEVVHFHPRKPEVCKASMGRQVLL
jgi:hypothetical protein